MFSTHIRENHPILLSFKSSPFFDSHQTFLMPAYCPRFKLQHREHQKIADPSSIYILTYPYHWVRQIAFRGPSIQGCSRVIFLNVFYTYFAHTTLGMEKEYAFSVERKANSVLVWWKRHTNRCLMFCHLYLEAVEFGFLFFSWSIAALIKQWLGMCVRLCGCVCMVWNFSKMLDVLCAGFLRPIWIDKSVTVVRNRTLLHALILWTLDFECFFFVQWHRNLSRICLRRMSF